MEELAYKITPPTWPDSFPPIDAARAERGRALFYEHCAGCHETFKTDGRHAQSTSCSRSTRSAPIR